MSRIAKQPIAIPEKTDVAVGAGRITVKGPRGELSRPFRPEIAIEVADGAVKISPKADTKQAKALWGTYASHLRNMFEGVTKGFEKKLLIEGVGFRAEVSGNSLVLAVGFSHPVKVPIPAGVAVKAEKGLITVSGSDKELVGQFAATVRAMKKPEPYKGKGIRYEGEVIRRKQGKKAATA